MKDKEITQAAKTNLINSIKSDLANNSDDQHDTAAYGRVGVYNMTQEQLLSELSNYGIDPYSHLIISV